MGAVYAEHIVRETFLVVEAKNQIMAFGVLIGKTDGWWLEAIAENLAQPRCGSGAALTSMRE